MHCDLISTEIYLLILCWHLRHLFTPVGRWYEMQLGFYYQFSQKDWFPRVRWTKKVLCISEYMNIAFLRRQLERKSFKGFWIFSKFQSLQKVTFAGPKKLKLVSWQLINEKHDFALNVQSQCGIFKLCPLWISNLFSFFSQWAV